MVLTAKADPDRQSRPRITIAPGGATTAAAALRAGSNARETIVTSATRMAEGVTRAASASTTRMTAATTGASAGTTMT